MADFIFNFFEGNHDANFVARLLCESGTFAPSRLAVKEFPSPVREFLENLYRQGGVEDIRVGEYHEKPSPVVALIGNNDSTHVLSFVTGGCTKTSGAISTINKIMTFAQQDEIGALTGHGHRFAILFFFDADSRGIGAVQDFFDGAYGPTFAAYGSSNMPAHLEWTDKAGVPVGLYVFCDGTGSGTGTLEDCIECALVEHNDVLKTAEGFLRSNHLDLPFAIGSEDDVVAARAKTHKAKFTVLGQREKALAGSSLAVTLRKSNILNGAFDFGIDSFPGRILRLLNNAFVGPSKNDSILTSVATAAAGIQPADGANGVPISPYHGTGAT